MIKNLKLNPKIHSIVVRVISSIIFAVMFILVLVIAEGFWPNNVINNMKYYVDTYLLMGLK